MVKILIKRFKFYSEPEFHTFIFNEDEITLLKGTSNSGKSTILEALYWCLYGSNKKVCPKGYTTTVKCPTVVKLILANGIEITRTKPPDTLEITGFNENGDILTNEAAQYWVEENYGTKLCFLATSYMRQGRESPLIELKNSERIQLLQELSFGKTLEDDKDNDPKYYSNKIDIEIKIVKNNLLSLEGKLEGLEDCYKKQSKTCEPYIKTWNSSKKEQPAKNVIKSLEKDVLELEDKIGQNKKNLTRLRKKWTEYESYNKEKIKLEEEKTSTKVKLENFPYNLEQLNKHLIWLEEFNKKEEQEVKVKELTLSSDNVSFLENNTTSLSLLSKEIILYKDHIAYSKSLKIEDDSKIEDEIASIQEKLTLSKQEDDVIEKHTLIKETYKLKKKARINWENKKKEIEENKEKLEKVKVKYENFFTSENVTKLIETLNLKDENKINKTIIADNYSSVEGFNKLTDLLKRKIYDLNIKTVELTCPECKTHLTLDDDILIKYNKINNSKDIITNCEEGIKTIRIIADLMKDYVNAKKLTLVFDEEEPSTPEEPSRSPIVKCDITSTEKQSLSKRLRALQTYRPLKLDILPNLLKDYSLSKLESYLNKEKSYKSYLEAFNSLKNIVLSERTLDIDKKKCQKNIADYKILKSKLDESTTRLKELISIDKPESTTEELEKIINRDEKNIKELNNLIEAGKRIIEINKLKDSLEDNKKEIKDLTDRYVALDRIKQIISDTKSLALEETVETLNSLLDEISKIMYDNDTKIIVSMFKELKNKDYLKAELNIHLVKGYDEEAISYDVDELSGGEKSRLSLALTLALSTISSTPFLFIDEGMSSMHASLRDLCSKVVKEYSTNKVVINICHTIGLGNFNKVLTIKEEENM